MSRWGQLGEILGKGVSTGATEYFKSKGIQQLNAILSSGQAQTPEQLIQAAQSIKDPWGRQAALEYVGQLVPQMRGMIAPAGSALISPYTGEIKAQIPGVGAKGKGADYTIFFKGKRKGQKTHVTNVDEETLKNLQEMYGEENVVPGNVTGATEKKTLFRVSPNGIVQQKLPDVDPDVAAKLLALRDKGGNPVWSLAETQNLPEAASYWQREEKEMADRISKLIWNNAFANLDDVAQREVMTYTREAKDLMDKGMDKYEAVETVIKQGRMKPALDAINDPGKWTSDADKAVAIDAVRRAIDYGADVEKDIIPKLKEKHWTDKEIKDVLEKAGYSKPVAISETDKIVQQLLMGGE